MATTYKKAFEKFLHHPSSLTPEDIVTLRRRDPWLAKAAVGAWAAALRWRGYKSLYPDPLPVVRLGRKK